MIAQNVRHVREHGAELNLRIVNYEMDRKGLILPFEGWSNISSTRGRDGVEGLYLSFLRNSRMK